LIQRAVAEPSDPPVNAQKIATCTRSSARNAAPAQATSANTTV
jgi:hypothetical protein